MRRVDTEKLELGMVLAEAVRNFRHARAKGALSRSGPTRSADSSASSWITGPAPRARALRILIYVRRIIWR
jgi:hypothetical protein